MQNYFIFIKNLHNGAIFCRLFFQIREAKNNACALSRSIARADCSVCVRHRSPSCGSLARMRVPFYIPAAIA